MANFSAIFSAIFSANVSAVVFAIVSAIFIVEVGTRSCYANAVRYHDPMTPTLNSPVQPVHWRLKLSTLCASWWYLLLLGAIALVLALSPSTWRRENRIAVARRIYTSTWQVLPWFTALSTLVSLVMIRIVLITALSYGLSQYALEMMVRVLVLELIPLAAALFVALRSSLTFNERADAVEPLERTASPGASIGRVAPFLPSLAQVRDQLVPQLIAGTFAVLSLAIVSSVIVLLLAYLNVYGLSPWGLAEYTRTVGRVFEPVVSIGFALKAILFGLAVATIPSVAVLEVRARGAAIAAGVQPGALRVLSVLVLIEVGTLAVKYI